MTPHPALPTPESLAILPMARADLPAVAALELRLFAEDSPWSEAMFAEELRAGHSYWVVREIADLGIARRGSDAGPAGAAVDPVVGQGVILGYAGLALGLDDADVQTIGLAPEVRGLGLGRALLRRLLQVAGDRPVHLEVRTDNAIALRLYESEGFARIGIRRRYYHPSGADAYTMVRPAPGATRPR